MANTNGRRIRPLVFAIVAASGAATGARFQVTARCRHLTGEVLCYLLPQAGPTPLGELTMAERRSTAGWFVAIPLPSGGFGYARSLDIMFAAYDLRTLQMAQKGDLHTIRASPALFIVGVHKSWRRRWKYLGKVALEEELLRPVDFAWRDIVSGRCEFYTRFPDDRKRSERRAATNEECRDLEPAWAWDPEKVEERLDLHFQGKPCLMLENYRARHVGHD